MSASSGRAAGAGSAGHPGQAGLVRGCCLLIIVLVTLAAAGAALGSRALAQPDLGAPPGGVSHGDTETAVAATLAASLALQLLSAQHALMVLSEHDLTVVAAARNPHPDRWHDLAVRIRAQQLVVSALVDVGPFASTGVVRLALQYVSGTPPQVTVSPTAYALGQFDIPQWLASRFAGGASSTLDLTAMLERNRGLAALRSQLECATVRDDGIHVGFHRPGVTADPSTCT